MTITLNTSSIDGLGSTGYADLDYFNEGTWSPQMFTSNGSQASLGSASGEYTRIGDSVFIYGKIENIDQSDLSLYHALEVRNLPYTCDANFFGFGGVKVVYGKGSSVDTKTNWQVQVQVATANLRFSTITHVSGTQITAGFYIAEMIDTSDQTDFYFNATYTAV
ncbi:uncharacterized protein METZ01_LOCUS296568 [marine metagenome]|uniref:Uncharacterized protein n=1 Tax=marine metagenome TaxID=408172 RepID=A0A382M3W3_9ZZZZ